MIQKLLPFAAVAVLGIASDPARAGECTYGIHVVQTGSTAYDPANIAGGIVRLALSSTTTGLAKNCQNTPVRILSADGADFRFRYADAQLQHTLINSSQVEGPRPSRIDLNGNARKDITEGRTVSVDLFAAPAGQFVRAGSYDANLVVQVGDAAPVPIVARLIVEPSFRFAAENGATTKSLSFGEVSQGAERSSSIYYLTNSAIQIRATSLNRGVLVHEDGDGLGAIPYVARYNGSPINLTAGPTNVARGYQGMSTQVDNLKVTIEPQTGKFAGKYRDTIVLEFIPY